MDTYPTELWNAHAVHRLTNYGQVVVICSLGLCYHGYKFVSNNTLLQIVSVNILSPCHENW